MAHITIGFWNTPGFRLTEISLRRWDGDESKEDWENEVRKWENRGFHCCHLATCLQDDLSDA